MVRGHPDDPYAPILDSNPELERKLYVEMTLVAISAKRRSATPEKSLVPPNGAARTIGFHFLWNDYPELLAILIDQVTMETYLKLSLHSNAMRDDIAELTRSLIGKIRVTANQRGYIFDRRVTDIVLRNRIRGYYNTQINNARARFATVRKKGTRDEQISAMLHRLQNQNAVAEDMQIDGLPSRKRCCLDAKSPLPLWKPLLKAPTDRLTEEPHVKKSKKSHETEVGKEQGLDEKQSASPLNSSAWKSRATVPEEGSYEWQVSERLRKITIGEDAQMDLDEDEENATMLAFVRVRLASGVYRSAIKFCHDVLQRLYREAYARARTKAGHLETYREKLAGAWCLYAQILWEVGALGRQRLVSPDNKKQASDQNIASTDDWRDYALATLTSATSCPLIGNHESIAITLSRILVNNTHAQEEHTQPQREELGHALAACKDGVRRAKSKRSPQDYAPIPLNEMDYRRMARHRLELSPLKRDPVTVTELEASFEAVMELPQLLEPASEHYFLVDGKGGIQAILAEASHLGSQHKDEDRTDKDESLQPRSSDNDFETDSTASSSAASSTKTARFCEDISRVCSSCSVVFTEQESDADFEDCIKCRKATLQGWGNEKHIATATRSSG